MKSVSSFSHVLRTDIQLYSAFCRLTAPLRVLESYCSSSCYFFFKVLSSVHHQTPVRSSWTLGLQYHINFRWKQ